VRTETEWVELIDQGGHLLAPPDNAESITSAISKALLHTSTSKEARSIFGEGDAAEKICTRLLKAS
jgi:UDP-N-acetylglucosamine 2-epimerase